MKGSVAVLVLILVIAIAAIAFFVLLSMNKGSNGSNESIGMQNTTGVQSPSGNVGIQIGIQNINAGGEVGLVVGYYHTCALKRDGTVWCWGSNLYGQLGIGEYTLANKPTPVQVVNLVVN